MNSLQYFSSLQSETNIALRSDELESIFAVYKAGRQGDSFSTLEIEVGKNENKTTFDLDPEAKVSVHFPTPSNVMIYCMGALADDESGQIPGAEDNEFRLDEKFTRFGEYTLLIKSPSKFSKRIDEAIKADDNIYGLELLQGGHGLVQYISMKDYSGHVGLFKKDIEYSWHREFRFSFCVKDEALNSKGAYEFNIGSIKDISTIVPTRSLIDIPMKIKRRKFKLIDGEYKQIQC